MVTNKSWHADPRHQGERCSLSIYLNDAHTGRRVHAELDRARHTRDLIVQMNQVGHAPVHQALVKHISPFDFSICFLFKGCCRQCIVTTCRAQLVPCWQKLIPYPSIKTHVCYLALPYCVLCYRVCTTHLVYVLQKSPCTIMKLVWSNERGPCSLCRHWAKYTKYLCSYFESLFIWTSSSRAQGRATLKLSSGSCIEPSRLPMLTQTATWWLGRRATTLIS